MIKKLSLITLFISTAWLLFSSIPSIFGLIHPMITVGPFLFFMGVALVLMGVDILRDV